ncbi:hypothetical protein NB723_002991 [Xanthomonas sacchari]|nr:hypothetical protein [Xanthomonas sacchari]
MAVPSRVATVKLTPALPAGWLSVTVNTNALLPLSPSARLTLATLATGRLPPPHRLTGAALLRGVGAPVAKSALLLSLSVQPPLPRSTARVLLGAAVGALPSAQLALLP